VTYKNEGLQFSFSLPDGWRQLPSVIPPLFTSECGGIQVKVSTVLPKFADPNARREFMVETCHSVIPQPHLGDERQNVLMLIDNGRKEGWLSAVRDGLHYEVTWDNAEDPRMEQAVRQVRSSFCFAPAAVARAQLDRAAQLRPEQRVIADLLQRPAASTQEVAERLASVGMQPIYEGKTMQGWGYPSAKRRKWWQFWKG
jgi:hypothetical protein